MSLQKCIVRIAKFEPFGTDAKFMEFQFAEADFVTVGFQAVHVSSRRSLYQDAVVKVGNVDKTAGPPPKEAIVKTAWDMCRPIFEAWADACSDHDSIVGMSIQPYE